METPAREPSGEQAPEQRRPTPPPVPAHPPVRTAPDPTLPVPAGGTHEVGSRTYVVADVEPLDVTGVRTVGVGAALWLVALVLLLPFYGWLEEHDRVWWIWTCVAGFGLGMFGFDFCRRRARRLGHHV